MKDFIREKVCFYSSMFPGRSSAWEIARYAAKRGAAGVELMGFCDELRTPDMKTAREIGDFAKANGLALPCFSAGINFAAGDAREKIERMKGYVDICEALEIPYFHHTVVLSLEKPADFDAAAKIGIEATAEINEYAARHGVKTIIEDQGFVFNGVKNYSLLIDGVKGDLGTLLDVGNIMFVDERAEDFLDAYAEKTVHVHIKDYKLTKTPLAPSSYKTLAENYLTACEIGTGDINFEKIADGLRKINYGGYYSMEFENVSGEDEIDRVLERMYSWFGE